jgi:hypothetical protein
MQEIRIRVGVRSDLDTAETTRRKEGGDRRRTTDWGEGRGFVASREAAKLNYAYVVEFTGDSL